MNTDNSNPETITIQLTRGQTAVIDVIDADLDTLNWRYGGNREGSNHRYVPYVVRSVKADNGRYKTEYLHRVILYRKLGRELIRGEVCDHIDGNSMNNSRSNLRVATQQQNTFNAKGRRDSKSGYKGVSWNKKTKRWRAGIRLNGKQIHLGYFDDPKEAHEAYKVAAAKYYEGYYTPR